MDRERIETTVERLIGHADRLRVAGNISHILHATMIREIQAWGASKRQIAAATELDRILQTEYQADWLEERDGAYR